MEEWMEQKHVQSTQIIHIDVTIFIIVFISSIIVITILLDHIRRWLSGLVIMMEGWDIQLILQVRFFSFTRSYAALRAADLDWIISARMKFGRVHFGEKP